MQTQTKEKSSNKCPINIRNGPSSSLLGDSTYFMKEEFDDKVKKLSILGIFEQYKKSKLERVKLSKSLKSKGIKKDVRGKKHGNNE